MGDGGLSWTSRPNRGTRTGRLRHPGSRGFLKGTSYLPVLHLPAWGLQSPFTSSASPRSFLDVGGPELMADNVSH